jgi:hypothetical protein
MKLKIIFFELFRMLIFYVLDRRALLDLRIEELSTSLSRRTGARRDLGLLPITTEAVSFASIPKPHSEKASIHLDRNR